MGLVLMALATRTTPQPLSSSRRPRTRAVPAVAARRANFGRPFGSRNLVSHVSSPTTAPTVRTPTTDEAWEASCPVDFSSSPSRVFTANKVIVVGKRAAILDETGFGQVPAHLQPTIKALLRDTKSGTGGASRTSLIISNESDKGDDENAPVTTEVTVVVLPETSKLSRHNAPSGSHALFSELSSFAKPPSFGKSVGIVCCLSHVSEAPAVASAVARAFPTYTAKGGAKGGAEGGNGDSKNGNSGNSKETFIAARGDVRVCLVVSDGETELSPEALARAVSVARGVRFAQRIVDTPPAQMDPSALVREAVNTAAVLNRNNPDAVVGVQILRMTELATQGFGGIVGVGLAAANDGREPALVVLTHKGKGSGTVGRSTALVGKGITFDTGGLQIKGGAGMVGMKTDLGGAAAVLGSFRALVELDQTGEIRGGGDLHAVLCIAENALGASSFRPDDVLIGKSGLSMEINNTDAEGRLVLADGVAFASGGELGAVDDIIDVATLTGAQMVATGRFFAGIVSDSETMETECVRAGKVRPRGFHQIHPTVSSPWSSTLRP